MQKQNAERGKPKKSHQLRRLVLLIPCLSSKVVRIGCVQISRHTQFHLPTSSRPQVQEEGESQFGSQRTSDSWRAALSFCFFFVKRFWLAVSTRNSNCIPSAKQPASGCSGNMLPVIFQRNPSRSPSCAALLMPFFAWLPGASSLQSKYMFRKF